MGDLYERYLNQKDVVSEAWDKVNQARTALENAEYQLSLENAILDGIAKDIARSDDPIIKVIRELYQSGELK